jgi:hypothetical protein
MQTSRPSIQCEVCSSRACYVQVECDISLVTYKQLMEFLNDYLVYERDLMAVTRKGGSTTLISETNN